MNAVDILLGLDADSLGFKNEKELEIKRLSQKAGKPFIYYKEEMHTRQDVWGRSLCFCPHVLFLNTWGPKQKDRPPS